MNAPPPPIDGQPARDVEIWTDGSWKNGKGGYGLAWRTRAVGADQWEQHTGRAVALKDCAGSGEAEWKGLEAAMDLAFELCGAGGVRSVYIGTDYKPCEVKFQQWMEPLVEGQPDPRGGMSEMVKNALRRCDSIGEDVLTIEHNHREANMRADSMARKGRLASESGHSGLVGQGLLERNVSGEYVFAEN